MLTWNIEELVVYSVIRDLRHIRNSCHIRKPQLRQSSREHTSWCKPTKSAVIWGGFDLLALEGTNSARGQKVANHQWTLFYPSSHVATSFDFKKRKGMTVLRTSITFKVSEVLTAIGAFPNWKVSCRIHSPIARMSDLITDYWVPHSVKLFNISKGKAKLEVRVRRSPRELPGTIVALQLSSNDQPAEWPEAGFPHCRILEQAQIVRPGTRFSFSVLSSLLIIKSWSQCSIVGAPPGIS